MTTLPDLIEGPQDPLTEGEEGLRTARNFDVLARSAAEARRMVMRQGIVRGAKYRSLRGETLDDALVCTNITVDPQFDAVLGGLGRYSIKALYGAQDRNAVPGGPPIYRLRGSMSSEPVDIDANGNAILNAADEPIDPPLTKPSADEVVHVEWWVESSDQIALQAWLRQFRNAVNSVPWQGAIAESIRCNGAEIAEVIEANPEEGGGDWVKLVADFEYRDPIDPGQIPATIYERKANGTLTELTKPVGGWWGLYANRGRRAKREMNGSTRYPRIRMPVWDDETGEQKLDALGNPMWEPVDEPVPLDAAGLPTNAQSAIVVPLFRKKARFQDMGI